MNSQIGALFHKEIRQILHKPGAVASAIAFPFAFLVLIPAVMALVGGDNVTMTPVGGIPFPTALNDEIMSRPGGPLANIFVPLYVAITGLALPSILAVYAIASEKEKRTIDLLLALPVSVGDILTAKLASVTGTALAVTFPLLLVDYGLILYSGLFDPVLFAGIALELLAALAFSTATAMVLGLLAKDYRTANNLSGLFMGPMIPVSMAIIFLGPFGPWRLFIEAGLLLLLALAITYVALKRVTLESMAL